MLDKFNLTGTFCQRRTKDYVRKRLERLTPWQPLGACLREASSWRISKPEARISSPERRGKRLRRFWRHWSVHTWDIQKPRTKLQPFFINLYLRSYFSHLNYLAVNKLWASNILLYQWRRFIWKQDKVNSQCLMTDEAKETDDAKNYAGKMIWASQLNIEKTYAILLRQRKDLPMR